ncbi:MAG: transcription elongation factor GreA [Hyphomonadaceae bacterium]|nr:transcription elongation factor GreA [Hyphomonadaceae bacterium]
MSKAFTRESDEDGAAELPEREVSAFPNLVTAEGLAAIDAEIERYSGENARALAAGDKEGLAKAGRELRYWTARRNSALIQPAPADRGEVRFGSTVTIAREDGRKATWRIVGEDEANPAKGTLSHASPLARALMGLEVGDTVVAGAGEAEIVGISS